MFRGLNAINLDAKGRVAVPTKYRERLQEECDNQFVLTIDTDSPCLLLYPLPEWEVIEKKLEALPSFNSHARRIQRLLIGHATELEMDNNGRLLVPPLLRDYSKLEKRVMLVGQGKKFEVWSERLWQESRQDWLDADESDASDEVPPELKTISL